MFTSHSSGPPAIFMVFFFVIFAIVVARILIKVVSVLGESSSNNSQPVLTGEAEIVSKRMEVAGGEKSTSTIYYATFELASAERRELKMWGSE